MSHVSKQQVFKKVKKLLNLLHPETRTVTLTKIHIKQLLPVFLLAALAITIASLTVGKDIYNAHGQSLLSFAIVNFSGYLFFLIMPVELAFIYYLHSGLDVLYLNLTAIGTAMASQLVDYYIGRSFSTRIIDKLIGRRRYEKAEAEIRKYGNIAIFLFNLSPLSSPVIVLAAGMLNHRLKEVLFYSFLGLLLKYLLITFIF